jgi:hypothetical protein
LIKRVVNSELNRCELLADYLFASWARPRPLPEERASEGRWRIYSDNIAMARWLQTTVQGMLNAELSDTTIPCAEATFSKAGDPRYFWTEYIKSHSEDISLTWFEIGEAASHSLAAKPDPQPALRRVHCIDTSARHAPRP